MTIDTMAGHAGELSAALSAAAAVAGFWMSAARLRRIKRDKDAAWRAAFDHIGRRDPNSADALPLTDLQVARRSLEDMAAGRPVFLPVPIEVSPAVGVVERESSGPDSTFATDGTLTARTATRKLTCLLEQQESVCHALILAGDGGMARHPRHPELRAVAARSERVDGSPMAEVVVSYALEVSETVTRRYAGPDLLGYGSMLARRLTLWDLERCEEILNQVSLSCPCGYRVTRHLGRRLDARQDARYCPRCGTGPRR